MSAPKSAAEVMRELAVQECRIVMRDAANVISRDGVGEIAVISGVVASGLMGVIGKLPIPADTRDAEIAKLRAAVTGLTDHMTKMQHAVVGYLVPDGNDEQTLIEALIYLLDGPEQRMVQDAARAALAQPGDAG